MPTFRSGGPRCPKSGNLLPHRFLPSHHHHHRSSLTPPSQPGTSPGPKVSMPPPPSFAMADENPVARERHVTKDAWQRRRRASTVTTRTTATTKGATAMTTPTIKPGPATTTTAPTTHHRHVIHVDDRHHQQPPRRLSAAGWKWSKEVTTRPGRNRPTRDGGRFPPAVSAPSAYPPPVTHPLTTCKTQPPRHPTPPPNANPTAMAATTPFECKRAAQPLPHRRMWAPATSPAVTSARTFNPPPPPRHQHP